MSTPYIALYPSDYLADTAHLGLSEHGVYWRMLLHYYQHGKPFPNETDKINRVILATTPEEKRIVEYILVEYFLLSQDDDGVSRWHHARADKEIAAAESRVMEKDRSRQMGSIGGKRSAEARRVIYGTAQPSKPQKSEPTFEPPFEPPFENGFEAKIEVVPKQPEPEPEPEKRRTTLSGKPDVTPQAKELLQKLNDATGRNYKPVASNIGMIKGRLAEYSFEDLSEMIDSKVSEWRYDDKMCKYLRPETLFNATKCAQYVGEIGAVMVGGVDLSKFKE